MTPNLFCFVYSVKLEIYNCTKCSRHSDIICLKFSLSNMCICVFSRQLICLVFMTRIIAVIYQLPILQYVIHSWFKNRSNSLFQFGTNLICADQDKYAFKTNGMALNNTQKTIDFSYISSCIYLF